MARLYYSILMALVLVSCSDLYEKPLPSYDSEMVVEAYVNQANPFLNYALVTKSVAYDDQSPDVLGVSGAVVTLYEGKKEGTELVWEEDGIEYEAVDTVPGLYFPPLALLFTATEGAYYKLVVEADGIVTTAVTQVPQLVEMDSVWVDYVYNENVDSIQPFLKFGFQDPDAFGNHYMIYDYRDSELEWPLLWGALDLEVLTDDVFFNGQRFVYTEAFPREWGDTTNFYLSSITQQTHDFWESYENSRDNGGPFSQPINVNSTFDNSRGIFQGMAVDTRRIIVQKP